MTLYSFEVRRIEDDAYLGRVVVGGQSAEAAGGRGAKWAAAEGYKLSDLRVVHQVGAPAPENYFLFKPAEQA